LVFEAGERSRRLRGRWERRDRRSKIGDRRSEIGGRGWIRHLTPALSPAEAERGGVFGVENDVGGGAELRAEFAGADEQ
jgi:hypothetical protein